MATDEAGREMTRASRRGIARAHFLMELGYTLERASTLVQENLVFQQYRARFAEVEAQAT